MFILYKLNGDYNFVNDAKEQLPENAVVQMRAETLEEIMLRLGELR